MDERRPAILQGIIDAADSTPEQKLRAVELLNADDGDGHEDELRDFSHLSDGELDASLDQHLSGDLPQLVANQLEGVPLVGIVAETWGPMPRFAKALAREVERRAEARARELADADWIEAELERKAQERAEQMYRGRSFAAVEGAQTLQDGSSASSLA
jgi:hypothetical protein